MQDFEFRLFISNTTSANHVSLLHVLVESLTTDNGYTNDDVINNRILLQLDKARLIEHDV